MASIIAWSSTSRMVALEILSGRFPCMKGKSNEARAGPNSEEAMLVSV